MQNQQFNPLQGLWSTVCRLFLLTTFFTGFAMMATPDVRAQMSGAIFTTDSGGNTNVNQYPLKTNVYLNGGPVHEGAAGLPPGNYYCQVTTPNGGLLGKTLDPTIVVTDAGKFFIPYHLIDILYTASSGFTVLGFDDTTNNGGEYKVWVSSSPDFPGGSTKTDNFKVEEVSGPPDPDPDPENPKAELCAIKFYDSNVNGIKDEGEVTINDWLVRVDGAISLDPLVTSLVLATPSCIFVDIGAFTVTELDAVESNWVHTTPTVVNVLLIADQHLTVEFGNVCIGAGGGKTLGFWSNKNGAKLVTAPDLVMLSGLNLRNADGSEFNPADYASLRAWLLNGNAVNMAYMLSVQLAATELNGFNGLLTGTTVYAPDLLPYPGTGVSDLGFISIINLMNAANTELGLHGLVPSGDANRAYQAALKDALDDANNNLNFVEPVFDPVHCPFSFVLPTPTP